MKVEACKTTAIENTGLTLTRQDNTVYPSDSCDGCGQSYAPQEILVTNIDSCCGGGCCRSLCRKCITAAYFALEEANKT